MSGGGCKWFLLAIAVAGTAGAAPPLITEDTGTQGKGVAQLEFTVEMPREQRGDTSYDGVEASLVLNYGIAENADLQFVLPYLRATEHTAGVRTKTEGLLDARINLKWRFYENDTFSLALMPGVILPTGKEGLSTERVNPGAFLIASWEPEPLALHADIGYRYLDNVLGLRKDLYHASVSAHYTLRDTLKLVADQSWENTLDPGPTGTVRYTTLGAIWAFAPGAGIGCGVKLGHGEFAVERTYLCGVGLRLDD
jgi:hypothetical protein